MDGELSSLCPFAKLDDKHLVVTFSSATLDELRRPCYGRQKKSDRISYIYKYYSSYPGNKNEICIFYNDNYLKEFLKMKLMFFIRSPES